MKKGIVLEISLTCILVVTGWWLFDTMKYVESNNPELKIIENNNNIAFSDGAGIDVMGNNVYSVFSDKADGIEKSVAAFLLRYDSLDADLQFWNEVSNHLSGIDNIRLTAYCENDRCVEAVRKKTDMVDFTVLEYGEILDMQAVIEADAVGEFCLRKNRFKRINWRDGIQKPFDVAMSIGLGQ